MDLALARSHNDLNIAAAFSVLLLRKECAETVCKPTCPLQLRQYGPYQVAHYCK